MNENQSLEPLEIIISRVISEHAEYHYLLTKPDAAIEHEYRPEAGQTNPFLHMGMHIALREQIGADRPQGIAALHRNLLVKFNSAHELEHQMMECLGESLWQAQREQRLPDEMSYLDCIRNIA